MSFDIFGNSGRRKGTIRKERGFFGDTSYVTRDNYGRKKSTTRKETGFFGDTGYVTRDNYREFDSCLQFFTNQIAQNVDYINAFEFFYCQIR